MFVIYDILAVGFLINGNERRKKMKKLSIVAVICIIAMLFASCSPSIPAPTEPQEGDTETILSIITAATGLTISEDDITGISFDENGEPVLSDIISIGEDGVTVNLDVSINKDIAAEDNLVFPGISEGIILEPATITSGKLALSVGAKINAQILPTATDESIQITIPIVPGGEPMVLNLLVSKAEITLKSSGTEFVANVGAEAIEHKVTLNVNKTSNIISYIPDIMKLVDSVMAGGTPTIDQVVELVFKAFSANSFDLRLDGTRLDVKAIVDEIIALQNI